MTDTRSPNLGTALRHELAMSPGRIALLLAPPSDDGAMRPLAQAWSEPIVSAGDALTETDQPPTPGSVMARVHRAALLNDIEILFDPELALDPIVLLRGISRRHPTVWQWPGEVVGPEALYSQPGRRDHYQGRLSDAVILRFIPSYFPDEPPYRIERVPQ